ncbi:MAG: RNA polymerase factor sigma-54 [Tissierellia bacterium]|nr:RNA polymerase factor sigma-54 [Tissierellia bacterium]
MRLQLNLEQRQELHMTQELRQAIQLLSLSDQDLLDRINQEAIENVLIDFSPSQAPDPLVSLCLSRQAQRRLPGEGPPTQEGPLPDYSDLNQDQPSFYDYLCHQWDCQKLDPKDRALGLEIIGEIGPQGYLQLDLKAWAKARGVSFSRAQKILSRVQKLDPPGVGARNLKECLLAQTQDPLLEKIIEDHLEDLAHNRAQVLAKALDLDLEATYQAMDQVRALDPLPISGYREDRGQVPYVQPEIFISLREGKIHIEIPSQAKNSFHISDYYLQLLASSQGDLRAYLEKKARRAFFLREAILERQKNIEKVVTSLVHFQEGFFLEGRPLVPLTMERVAQDQDLSESTVSRVTDNKYLECCQGIFSLKDFFPSGLASQAGQVSSPHIKALISKFIQGEDPKKPLSDQKLVVLLQEEAGIDIKRRTVAKYRQEEGIPSSSMRKKLL